MRQPGSAREGSTSLRVAASTRSSSPSFAVQVAVTTNAISSLLSGPGARDHRLRRASQSRHSRATGSCATVRGVSTAPPPIVDAVATALRYEGFDVAQAANGREALSRALELEPN